MMRCLQCGEPLDADDTYGLCGYCTCTEEPEPADEETISTVTLAELREKYGNPLADARRIVAERADLEPKQRPDGRWEVAA